MFGGYGFGYGPLGQEHFPLKKVNGYPNDRTITIDIALKPNFEYQNKLTEHRIFFRRMADQNTLIRFKTGSKKKNAEHFPRSHKKSIRSIFRSRFAPGA